MTALAGTPELKVAAVALIALAATMGYAIAEFLWHNRRRK